MNIMVIGGGGREHAVIQSLKKNETVRKIWCLPGNGGIAQDAECVPVKATDLEGIVEFAKTHPVDFAVVTPDDPLCLGLVDLLEEIDIPCFGPNKRAAIIEGSKVFSKELMKKYQIPTAESETFSDPESAFSYLKGKYPAVIKADGLALGKGVFIVRSDEEAKAALKELMIDKVFRESGSKVLVEEYLEGPEVSVLSFTDGKTVVPLLSSMDHKRAKEGDLGLNTGGMGTIAPNPFFTKEVEKECFEKIFYPTIRAMNAEKRTFRGCLYFGLMLTKDGPKVIEYNCRFGDPETQVVLPLLKSDLLSLMLATRNGELSEDMVSFSKESCCCVVLSSAGYPEKYETGFELSYPETKEGEEIFFAGVKRAGEKLVTSGGRVVNAVARGKNLQEAIKRAYALADKIKFENSYRRGDIGARALKYLEERDGL